MSVEGLPGTGQENPKADAPSRPFNGGRFTGIGSGDGGGPVRRPRRMRRTSSLRALVRETRLTTDDLILPVFVTHEPDAAHEIASMPGIHQWSVERAVEYVEGAAAAGIRAVILFGIPETKDATGSGAFAPDGVVQRAIAGIRERCPDVVVIADTCLCEYTEHGHCGVLDPRFDVDNDATLDILQQVAVSQAKAGADIIAPSGMIDGMVAAIREALDGAGFADIAILSYSAKYASAYYGPFRDAAQGAPAFGDRRSHQMDPANAREALLECAIDVEEAADMLMVKPALAYLDIVRQTRDHFPETPLVVYNVSGEYAMVKAAAQAGWLNERSIVMETLTGMKRAGADMIITYHAMDVAGWLRET